jgi:hypothetical protein
MEKSMRCRLRLHRWDERENPETKELYQICLRCNAYRDRGLAPVSVAGAMGLGSPWV